MVATDRAPYLLALRLAGRRVVVAGGGNVAARRVPALLDAGAEVIVISPGLSPALDDLATGGRIAWTAREYASGDCAGAWLVCACTDDPAVNAAIAAEADAARIWCVRADDAAASRAWTPASGQAGEVRVGVLTGDPRRSAGIRDALVGALSSGAVGARRGRRRNGGVALVGGGPGDPGLITVRGRALLAEADVVVADRLAPQSLLAELPADVEIVDAAKIPRGRAMAQEYINSVLVSRARAGRFVVRLKGGDPFVFGRGAEELLACLRAGIAVTVVPGVSSAIAVPGIAGVPLTHRGVVQEFHVISAHVPPGDERSTVNWAALGPSPATLVLLMATEHLQLITDALMRHGRDPKSPVSVIADGTLPTQRKITATLDTVAHDAAEAGIRPPAVVVVGEVVTIAAQIAELCSSPADGAPGGTFLPGVRPTQVNGAAHGNDLVRRPAQ
ncbi:MAG TPA: uroporphyrinogen-III C-methyltransferase [Streptosporangiaceae bacterium]|nr:uroporphyrinogen-III C-methyltransferase [Streptosporangiaceae bacterium]